MGSDSAGLPPSAAADTDAWRRQMRAELIARRQAAPVDERRAWSLSISLQLLRAMPWQATWTVGFCWPYKAEFDARPLMRTLRGRGMRNALPVVVQRGQAMIFRAWAPGVAMRAGSLGIAYPVDTPVVHPELLLVPLVGYGRHGDRLGYGGGYFDRTLAGMTPRPLCIGVGFDLCQLETTFPQAHDIPMDAVVTQSAVRLRDQGELIVAGARTVREQLEALSRERREVAQLLSPSVAPPVR